MSRFRSRGGRVLGAALLGAVLVAAGCGSTRSDRELARASQSVPAVSATPAPETPAGAASESSAQATAAGSLTPAPAAAPATKSALAPATKSALAPAQAVSPAKAPGQASQKAPAAAGSTTPAPGSQGTPAPAPPAPGAPQPPAASGPKSQIVLGSVGTDSGVVGAILAPLVEGAKVWAADVNSRGGLNGHPVRVIFGDDAGEPARAQALARRMVDQDHVVAFYQEHGPGTMQSVVPYLEEKKIPFIGSCQCTIPVAHSPIFFEVGPSGDHGVAWAHLGPLLAFSEKRKVSIMYCREAQTCPSIKDRLHEFASAAGINIVHEAQVSLAQPDYTAEVLAARNAGAEAILGAVDNSSVIRLARSAHRQDYYPEIVMQYTGHNETLPGFGGKDVEGILVSGSFPHWTSPKLADYRAAMARFGPKVPKASWSMTPYITGKLLELISKGFPENPTSADFLKGLYALNGETLGGIIPPLTFREGEGSDGNNLCIVPMKIENGNFNPKNGDNFTCLPGWAPPQK